MQEAVPTKLQKQADLHPQTDAQWNTLHPLKKQVSRRTQHVQTLRTVCTVTWRPRTSTFIFGDRDPDGAYTGGGL